MKMKSVRLDRCWLGLLLVVLVPGLVLGATPVLDSGAAPKGAFNILIQAVGDWQQLEKTQNSKEIALSFEENLSFPSLVEIARLEDEISAQNERLEELNEQYLSVDNAEGERVFLESIDLVQSQIEILLEEKVEYEEIYAGRKDKQQTSIKSLKAELEDLKEEIEKQQQLIKKQFNQTFGQLFFVLGVLVFLLFMKFLLGKLLARLTHAMSERRQQVLLRLNRIFFNVLIVVILLGMVSSQLMSLLPFLALLGTGIAFAVRDALSSFLGWFLIGGDNGYRKGNIIQLGDSYGRVFEVTPFLTMIKEIRGDHETGKLISFPNKVIFEQAVSHFSKYDEFVHKELSFLLSEKTNIDAAEALLRETINDWLKTERKPYKKALEHLTKHHNLTADDLAPLVWIEINDHGIALRARFLVRISTASFSKSSIEKNFFKAVRKSKNIQFHYTDSGRNQGSMEDGPDNDRDANHFH